MVGIAVVILAIIVISGRPEPAPRPQPASNTAPAAPNADRLREYQERLRLLDERARQHAMAPAEPVTGRSAYQDYDAEPPAVTPAPPPDPIEVERKRREYESLFAGNVVISRRPEGARLLSGEPSAGSRLTLPSQSEVSAAPPNLDAIADAVLRASTRYPPDASAASGGGTPPAARGSRSGAAPTSAAKESRTESAPISDTGPLHRLLEGTVIDTVLTNRLDGSLTAPVNCLVTNPIYSHNGHHVVIPAGSRVLGETKPVQTYGDARLAVAFHRLLLPNGRTYSLNQFLGLNQRGDAGLRDHVDRHYRSTFGASAAIGLITGFAQLLGTSGFGTAAANRPLIVSGSVSDASSQATARTLDRLLNRLPTITIREGHRIKVYLTRDLELPSYDASIPPLSSAIR
jgi:type IV secretory pathway VirB10-like protein